MQVEVLSAGLLTEGALIHVLSLSSVVKTLFINTLQIQEIELMIV